MRERIRALLHLGTQGPSSADPARNPDCTEFEIDNWSVSRFVLAKLVPVVGIQPFPLHELMLMWSARCVGGRRNPCRIGMACARRHVWRCVHSTCGAGPAQHCRAAGFAADERGLFVSERLDRRCERA